MVRFSCGERPLRRHLRAWMMKWVTRDCAETTWMKRQRAWYESQSSTPAAAARELMNNRLQPLATLSGQQVGTMDGAFRSLVIHKVWLVPAVAESRTIC